MTTDYKPHKNSLVGKVCAFFAKNPSEELTTWDICQKFGVGPAGIKGALVDAVGAGMLTLAKNADFDPCYGPGPNIARAFGDATPVPDAAVLSVTAANAITSFSKDSIPDAPPMPTLPAIEIPMTKTALASTPKAAPKSKPVKPSAATKKHPKPLHPTGVPVCSAEQSQKVLSIPGLGEFVVRSGVKLPPVRNPSKDLTPALLGIEVGECVEFTMADKSSAYTSIAKAHAAGIGKWTRSETRLPGSILVWRNA